MIRNEMGAMLYFWGEHCNVCHALQPKLFEAFEKNFPKIKPVTNVIRFFKNPAGF